MSFVCPIVCPRRSDTSRSELAELTKQVNPDEIDIDDDEDEDEDQDAEPEGEMYHHVLSPVNVHLRF